MTRTRKKTRARARIKTRKDRDCQKTIKTKNANKADSRDNKSR